MLETPSHCFPFVLNAILRSPGTGINWTNLNTAPYLNDGVTMLTVYFMLVFDVFFYMLLTMYVDTIKPGKYGVGAPFYFPFKVSASFPHRFTPIIPALDSL